MATTRKYLCDDGIFRFPDGREVCDLTSKKGMDAYLARKKAMWLRQGKVCGLRISPSCMQRAGALRFGDSYFGHEVPRGHGGGSRDDRIWIERDGKMVPLNYALCFACNDLQGSRRISNPLRDLDDIIM